MSESNKFPGFENVEDYTKAALQATLACVRTANQLDASLFEYYNSFKGFRKAIAKERRNVLSIISGLIPGQTGKEEFKELDEDEQVDFLKDVNSSILENVSYLMDETDGHKKPGLELVITTREKIPINTSWNQTRTPSNETHKNFSLLSAKNISRPQITFKDKIDNSNAIFVPVIKEKPNSLKPLAIVLEKDENGVDEFCHPYEFELERFEPPPKQLLPCKPSMPKPVKETKLTYIDTVEDLNTLAIHLKKQLVFSVDVEHHSYRSFQGFSCLIQISTREQDFIIDGLSLRSDLWVLNEVFTDPKITKVLHGADMDIIWLQRDYGLYVVNMFDTGQAARVLNFPHLSLAYLTRHYCKYELDKKFKLADWRMRPLPEELLNYAREDTHYLLYIFDCMKNELLKKGNEQNNLLVSVFHRSREICLKKYKKPLFTEEKYLDLHAKSRKSFNPRQLFCFKLLYEWRDKVARREDESCGYVLPNHMMLKICEVLPRDQHGILACCNPIPPLVQQHLLDLHSIITKAHNYSFSLIQGEQKETQFTDLYKTSSFDLNNMLHCPHDIHAYDDTRMHLQQLPDVADGDALKVLRKGTSLLFGGSSITVEAGESVSKVTAQKVEEEIFKTYQPIYKRYLLTLEQKEKNLEEKNSGLQEEKEEVKTFITPMKPTPITNALAESINTYNSDPEVMVLENSGSPEVLTVKKSKQARRKRRRNKESQSESNYTLPAKNSKTSVSTPVKALDEFQPFDYSQTSYSSATSNQGSSTQSRPFFQPYDATQTKKSGNIKKKKKGQGKQTSFNPNYNQKNSKKNWPTT